MARYRIKFVPVHVIGEYWIYQGGDLIDSESITLKQAIKAKRRLIQQDKEKK